MRTLLPFQGERPFGAFMSPIETHEMSPASWPAFETLFGENGACAGCWCVFWRLEKGERFSEVKGPPARERMKALVERGEARGLLAFVKDAPVGWLALGPRREFLKLDRAPSLPCDDADQVWSLPCFFVHRDWRGQDVATAPLRAALVVLERQGVRVVEAYPVKSPASGRLTTASAYTGTLSLFEKQGFTRVAERPAGKQRVRKLLFRAPHSPQGNAS